MAKKLKPVHPGEILREEFLKPLHLSMNKLALDLRIAMTRVADIVNERRGITADTALRLARYAPAEDGPGTGSDWTWGCFWAGPPRNEIRISSDVERLPS
jgi:addiction module HigA family antidote